MLPSFLTNVYLVVAELSRRLNEATSNEKKRQILLKNFYDLLLAPGDNYELARFFYCLELGLLLLAIPINLAVCWAVTQTHTFHPNLRLILFSNIMCGVLQATVRAIFVLHILTYEMLVSPAVGRKLFGLRAFFVNQMLLAFLNVFIERFVAYKMSARYEKAPLYLAVVIIVCWWISTYLLTYVVEIGAVTLLCILSPCVALFLANRWIKLQNTAPTGNASLSKRYQMTENIKTLTMCRPWIILYLITNVAHAFLLFAAIFLFLMDGTNSVKLLVQSMDILYAAYVATYTLVLVNGHQGLKAHFRILLWNRSKVTMESYNYLATTLKTNNEDFDGHFKRLDQAWA
uniref:G_PROTEIN_RECEP_F1_2 domain-containing protein n=1 Tax=Bursaphelenchus xylophilus TaxID=6326 RepID=A0A1I7RXP8_BURXY